MSTTLSDLVYSMFKINNKDCKKCIKKKNIKSKCDFVEFKNNRLNYKYKECGKRCPKSINEMIKKFPSVYQYCGGDFNHCVLLLRKGVYPYEYMDSWEIFDETLPPEKDFYSELNLIKTIIILKKYVIYLK